MDRPFLSLALLLLLAPATTRADSGTCRERYPTPAAEAAMFDVAWTTAERLDALPDVDVVIAARGGQDLSRYGLRHSHLAFLLRDDDGRWRAVHLLNRCKTDSSRLYYEGLANFIGETGGHTDLRIGLLQPALAARLKAMLQLPATAAHALHEPRYNVVAYPYRTDFQNSNGWVLEVLAAVMASADGAAPLQDRARVQEWLRANGYLPSVLHISLGKRVGARVAVANATTTDHPLAERVSGNYSVVTVESVFDFLRARQQLPQELSIPHVPVAGATAATP